MEDSIYRLRHGDILTLCVMGLLALGVVMVQSASMNATGALEIKLQELKAQRLAATAKLTDKARVAAINKEFEAKATDITTRFQERPTHWYWTPTGIKQLGFAFAAMLTFLGVGYFDYSRLARGAVWRNPVVWMVIVAAASCAAVLVPGIGREMNGARRWISIGMTQFQPSEV